MHSGMLALAIVFFFGPFFRSRSAEKQKITRSMLPGFFMRQYCMAFFVLVLASDVLPLLLGPTAFTDALGHAAYWLAACSALGEASVRYWGIYLERVLDRSEPRRTGD